MDRQNRRNMSVLHDERIGRLMFKLTIPAFLGIFVMTLYNVIDAIFIGHYVGHLGIAGLSIVFPFQMFDGDRTDDRNGRGFAGIETHRLQRCPEG